MSERIHSQSQETAAPATGRRRKFMPAVAGTALAMLVAAVLFQIFRAEPAASQTRDDGQTAGRASIASAASGQVVAKVNGEAVPYDMVARECYERHGAEVLDNIINRMIIQQECERRGVTVTQSEVQQEVINIAKKFNLPVDTWYQMLQAERGVGKAQYHRDIIWPMLALKKLASTDAKPTEEDMMKAFERDYGPRVKARMILVDGNLRHANQVWQKAVDDPDAFDRLASEVSSDPNTRPLGGAIPPIRKNGGSPQVEKEAFKLREGEISPVIQVAENRYVILKCEGYTDPIVTDIKQVWNELYQQLIEEKTQQSVARVFEDLKKGAQIHNFLTQTSTGGSPFAKGGTGIQKTSGVTSPDSVVPAAARR
ncbi:MAG: peptidylprolyl isomerase [Maioricimonas sp. JB045]|uniref:peptidylprolyl isomerase n=1 Tax=Maioricimonas sp. JC845 TaxID=3232138 RepID=UPI00345A3114